MESLEYIEWIEPRWARKEHHPTVFSLAQAAMPQRWLLMTAIAALACIPTAWVLAKGYDQPIGWVLIESLSFVTSVMIGLPAIILLLGFVLRSMIPTTVQLNPKQLVYGSRTIPTASFHTITVERSSSARPRLVLLAEGKESWIGVAADVDLDRLERVVKKNDNTPPSF
jgi:hypothetical protein